MSKKRIALVGPIGSKGGISAVVNSIIKCESISEKFEFIVINTSNYKDSNSFLNSMILVLSATIYLIKMIGAKVDLAHIHTSHGKSFYRKIFFVLISYFFGIRIILHFHASKFDEFFLLASGLRKKIIECVLKKCDSIVLLCNNWEEKLKKVYGVENTTVIANPVPFDFDKIEIFINEKESNVVTILFLGFMIESKGIYDIIKIALKLKEHSCQHRIIVCGKGEEVNNFLKMIDEMKLRNIEFFGWVASERKIDLLRKSDIFLLPSSKEGMPMAILEAMSCRLPIVSTKVGGIPELVVDGENGYLLNPGDIDGFAEKILSLILDTNKRKSFGQKSRSKAEFFKKEKIAQAWQCLYTKVLCKK